MACEACFSIWTPSTKPYETHHSTQYRSTCSFPARLKSSFINPRRPLSSSVSKSKPAGVGKKRKKKMEDDPWESLFQQLEKDLGNDTEDSSEKEITEEDVANFERELDMVVEELANVSDIGTTSELDDMLRAHSKDMVKDDDESDNDDEEGIKAKKDDVNEGVEDDGKDEDEDEDKDEVKDEDEEEDEEDNRDGDEDEDEDADYDDQYFRDDDFEEPRKVPLQRWQLRKLAAAAELGRRKVHVKRLAAELQLDRDDVLFFLKNPPPELLMAASEMDEERGKDDESVSDEESISLDDDETNDPLVLNNPDADQAISLTSDLESREVEKRTFGPRDWIKGKRIKKVQLATLQRVYKISKWPSNAMIESVVRATNLPRRRILEWFEKERANSGTQEPSRQSSASRKAWKRPVTHSFERLE